MLHFAGRVTLGVDVGNFLQLERAFESDGIVNAAAEKKKIAYALVVLGQFVGLIVAGDAAYNGDHLHLSESPDQQKRQEWIAALDTMESLKPRAVIAGHKRVGNDDSPRIIGETRKYIRDFERLAMQTTTARELYDEMLKLYPDWINRGALWTSVRAVKT